MLQKWCKLQIKVIEGVGERDSRHPTLPYVSEQPHIFGERDADIINGYWCSPTFIVQVHLLVYR